MNELELELELGGWGGGRGGTGGGGPVAATAAPAGLIICNTAAAQPVCSHPLMNTEMNVSHIGGERGGKNRPEPVLISSPIEQSLYPPLQLSAELVFNIPGHAP